MSVDMNEWWKFEVNDGKLKDFASLLNQSGEVNNWTIALTKMLLCFAANHNFSYDDLTANELIKQIKLSKLTSIGYVRYINEAVYTTREKLYRYVRRCHEEEFCAEIERYMFGANSAGDLSMWIVEFVKDNCYKDNVLDSIEKYVNSIINNYNRRETLVYKLPKQVVISIVAGIDVLDRLDTGDKVGDVTRVSTYSLRYKCENISPVIKMSRIACNVKLDERSIKILEVYRDNLSEDVTANILSSDLVNRFIHEKGEYLV